MDEFTKFFTDLGYKVDWDFRRITNETWYEIIDDRGIVICQIDKGVPLSDIIEDLICICDNIPSTSKSNYTISGPNTPQFRELCRRVKLTQIK